jgi:hypothetical protein
MSSMHRREATLSSHQHAARMPSIPKENTWELAALQHAPPIRAQGFSLATSVFVYAPLVTVGGGRRPGHGFRPLISVVTHIADS